MGLFEKQINDPVHGVIGLSRLEIAVINTRVFQRLHNVKQLGLGSVVYPGANYSRFSHSIGACYLAGQMMSAIGRNRGKEFSERDIQLHRLAGLLHDIGHYPFSHTFEHVIGDHYKDAKFFSPEDQSSEDDFPDDQPPVFDHELMGRRIIEHNEELKSVLQSHNLTVADVKAVFTSENENALPAIISSDLDCDRLDYLMRTATHAGLPYGKVDVPYIISQMTTDDKGRPCLQRKALKAADHFLISRYFDYTQLPFHKAVVAMEISLENVIGELLKRGKINCSSGSMLKKIASGEWSIFDDQYLMSIMRNEYDGHSAQQEAMYRANLISVLQRKPPKLVLSADCIGNRDEESNSSYKLKIQMIESKIDEWASISKIPKELWRVWKPKPLNITKMGSMIQVASELSPDQAAEDEEARSQMIWIKGLDPRNPAKAIMIT